jgi:hypothetical protein
MKSSQRSYHPVILSLSAGVFDFSSEFTPLSLPVFVYVENFPLSRPICRLQGMEKQNEGKITA